MVYSCKHCNFKRSVHPDHYGRKVACPKCRSVNTVGSVWAGEGGWQTVFNCHNCSFIKNVPAKFFGKSAPCPHCGIPIFVDRIPFSFPAEPLLLPSQEPVPQAPKQQLVKPVLMGAGVATIICLLLFVGASFLYRDTFRPTKKPDLEIVAPSPENKPVLDGNEEETGAKSDVTSPAVQIMSGANFSGQDLKERDFSRKDLNNSDFRNADLSGSNLFKTNLNGSLFDNALLVGANLSGASLRQVDFENADLTGAQLVDADLTGANLQNASIISADLTRARFESADISRTNFADANLNRSNLSGSFGQEASFARTFIGQAKLVEAQMRGADFSNAYIIDSDFSRSDLSEALFVGTQLIRCRLEGALLKGADLGKAVLLETPVSEMNFKLQPPTAPVSEQKPVAEQLAHAVDPVDQETQTKSPPISDTAPEEKVAAVDASAWRLTIEAGGLIAQNSDIDQNMHHFLQSLSRDELRAQLDSIFASRGAVSEHTGEIKFGVVFLISSTEETVEPIPLEIRWLTPEKRVAKVKVKKILPGQPQLEVISLPPESKSSDAWTVQFLFQGRNLAEYRMER